MKLSYRLVFSPTNNKEEYTAKYTCWDNTLHVRFREYNKPEVISGFMNKLTFLLTYVVNKNVLYEVMTIEDIKENNFKKVWKKYSEFIYKSNSLEALNKIIGAKLKDFSGITISKNYRKSGYSDCMLQFGSISNHICPVDENGRGSLALFAKTLFNLQYSDYLTMCQLQTFLFDDRYVIEIVEEDDNILEVNSKYINKVENRNNKKAFDELDLWN